ncbi:peroxisome assembly protein 12 [Ischnura elegans]|uniref:peroxisome assembly protein 12 n=1 Tax=Ischnura elegans TaxID=197161 RepID=UPI001ED87E3E|nr:peroxisome assembly protein 12 [Ischnura elegans]
MAERGAHMTAVSYPRPSIFELLAQESLASTIHPSCHQLAQFLATRNPERFGWVSNWFQETYFLMQLIVQYHYLRKHGASFSENFYGLVRVPIGSERLTGRHLRASLFTLVVVRYLKIKIDNWVKERKASSSSLSTEGEGWRAKFENVIIQSHGLFHAAWESVCLIQILTYMAGVSPTHSPLLSLSSLTLTNSSADTETEWHWKNIWRSELFPKLRFPALALTVVGNVLSHSLEMGAFFLQFLNWWNVEGGKGSVLEPPSIPEPPTLESNDENNRFSGKCPLCLGPRRVETVLPISGYVFCFRCIFSYVREHGCCPVTKYPTSLDELTRVHAEEN